jgi:hypothetical protein
LKAASASAPPGVAVSVPSSITENRYCMSALPLLVVVAVVAAVHPYYEPTCANPTSPTKKYNM